MMSLIGPLGNWELIVILIIALLIFGSRLPSVMRSLGKSVTEFKRGLHEVQDDINEAGKDEARPADGGQPQEEDEGATKPS